MKPLAWICVVLGLLLAIGSPLAADLYAIPGRERATEERRVLAAEFAAKFAAQFFGEPVRGRRVGPADLDRLDALDRATRHTPPAWPFLAAGAGLAAFGVLLLAILSTRPA